jgi:hypothetical protein
MQLSICHHFRAPLASVLATLEQPSYAAHLAREHSFFADIEVLSVRRAGSRFERVVRYRARPFITRLGLFSLPASWFVWVEHSQFDYATGLLTFDNVPELESVRTKMQNRGRMLFRAQHDEHGVPLTTRESTFELAFDVPLAYRALRELALSTVARQLTASLDEEAKLLARWVAQEGAQTDPELALTA